MPSLASKPTHSKFGTALFVGFGCSAVQLQQRPRNPKRKRAGEGEARESAAKGRTFAAKKGKGEGTI